MLVRFLRMVRYVGLSNRKKNQITNNIEAKGLCFSLYSFYCLPPSPFASTRFGGRWRKENGLSKKKFRPSIPQFCWNSFVVVVTYVHALSSSSQKILLIIFFGSECIVFPVGEERKSGDGEIRCFLLSSSEISQSSMLLSLFPFFAHFKNYLNFFSLSASLFRFSFFSFQLFFSFLLFFANSLLGHFETHPCNVYQDLPPPPPLSYSFQQPG